MLESLNIRNFALIEDLVIDFGRGFNVLSGETGAGKSIIIGALGLILGGKSSSEMVRTGAEMAGIEALFSVSPDSPVAKFLAGVGIENPGGDLVIRRTLSADGKSRCFINGVLSNLTILGELASLLVDIHGQHENQSLLKIGLHLGLLDEYAGLDPQVESFRADVRELGRLDEQLAALAMDDSEKARRIEFNSHAIKEIDQAELKENEESELEEESRLLANFEKLFASVEAAFESLGPAISEVRQAAGELETAGEHDPKLAGLAERIRDSYYSLEDVNDELRGWRGRVDFSPERLEEVNQRLSSIQGLKRKYGETIAEILAFRERANEENQSIQTSEEKQARLSSEIEGLKARLTQAALDLSQERQQRAREMEARIIDELGYLGMAKTVFKVEIRYVRDPEGFIEVRGERIRLFETGIDYVEFLVSPNPGEEARPLRKIASGGEMSRIMLAIKSVLSGKNDCETLVFDEVDAGIGGVTASAVGKKLKQVAQEHQVLCITHLPQIAALADRHIMVSKQIVDERTKTQIRRLGHDERLAELARMLGGEAVSETTLQQAREMIALGQLPDTK